MLPSLAKLRCHSGASTGKTYDSIRSALPQELIDGGKGEAPEWIWRSERGGFKFEKFGEGVDEHSVCAICTESLDKPAVYARPIATPAEKDAIEILEESNETPPLCGHAFHRECLGKLVHSALNDKKEPKCPTCRTAIPNDVVSSFERQWGRPELISALYLANVGELENLVNVLLAERADPNARDPLDTENTTALHLAIQRNLVRVATALVNYGADVNARDKIGNAPLHFAGTVEAATVLVDAGAIVTAQNQELSTALHHAARMSVELTEYLLRRAEGLVDTRDASGRTPLMIAAENPFGASGAPIARSLLRFGADPGASDLQGNTTLMEAAERGNVWMVSLLLLVVPSETLWAIVNARDGRGQTALMFASAGIGPRHSEIVKILGKTPGIQVNARNDRGGTAIYYAAVQNNVENARLLLEFGADKDAVTNEDTDRTPPLTVAVRMGFSDMAALLAWSKANVNHVNDRGLTPLKAAAERNFVSIAKSLLTFGAFVDTTDNLSHHPLAMAAKRGHVAMARLLLKKRADVNLAPHAKETALFASVDFEPPSDGREDMVRLLLERKADANAINHWGDTPLTSIVRQHPRRDQLPVVGLLLHYGANVNAVGSDGRNVLQSTINKDLQVFQTLLNAPGANVNYYARNGKSALIEAATCPSPEFLKAILEKRGVDVNQKDEDGVPALILAVRREALPPSRSTVPLLLDFPGIDVNATDNEGKTALVNAVLHDLLPDWVIKTLFAAPGIDVNVADNEGKTALMHAAHLGKAWIVEWLLAVPRIDVDAMNDAGKTALQQAKDEISRRMLEAFLQERAVPLPSEA